MTPAALVALLDGLSQFSHRAVAVLDARLREAVGIGYAQLRVLRVVVATRDRITTVRIARRIDLTRANVDKVTGQLVQGRLLTRERSARRGDSLRETELGYEACRRGEAILLEHTESVMRALAARQRELLATLSAYSRTELRDEARS